RAQGRNHRGGRAAGCGLGRDEAPQGDAAANVRACAGMTIEVKSTKAQPQETDPAQRYVLKDAERKSKIPAILSIFLVGLALYLKSIFPGSADPEQEEPSPE